MKNEIIQEKLVKIDEFRVTTFLLLYGFMSKKSLKLKEYEGEIINITVGEVVMRVDYEEKAVAVKVIGERMPDRVAVIVGVLAGIMTE
jgi:hypothetical protein